jgi:hypothetical protein
MNNIVKVSLAIQSHLNDALYVLSLYDMSNYAHDTSERLNFVKYLIFHFPDTNQEIDVDQQWNNFIKSQYPLKTK